MMAKAGSVTKMLAEQEQMMEDPIWQETETIFIPKKNPKDTEQFIGINGKTWLVQKGKQVEVPKPVAEVIRHSIEADERAEEYMEMLQAISENKAKGKG